MMIRITWFCRRCGKEAKTEDFTETYAGDYVPIDSKLCAECEYLALKEMHKAEIELFWKGGDGVSADGTHRDKKTAGRNESAMGENIQSGKHAADWPDRAGGTVIKG